LNTLKFSANKIFLSYNTNNTVSCNYNISENNEINIEDKEFLSVITNFSSKIILLLSAEEISTLFLKIPDKENVLIDEIIKTHISRNTVFKLDEIIYTYSLIENFEENAIGAAITYITLSAFKKYNQFIKKYKLSLDCVISPVYVYEALLCKTNDSDSLIIFLDDDYSQIALARKKNIYYCRNSQINNLIFDIDTNNNDLFIPLCEEINNTKSASGEKIENFSEILLVTERLNCQELKSYLSDIFKTENITIINESIESILFRKSKFKHNMSFDKPKSMQMLPDYIRKKVFLTAALAILFIILTSGYFISSIIFFKSKNITLEQEINKLKKESAEYDILFERVQKKSALFDEIIMKDSINPRIDIILEIVKGLVSDSKRKKIIIFRLSTYRIF